jgi:hypothetical protein
MSSTVDTAMLAEILSGIEELRQGYKEVLERLPIPETFNVTDIAVRRGCSRTWLLLETSPWRLPNFGRPDEGEGTRRWRRETVLAWYASAKWEAERRKEWEDMPPAKRKELMES